MGTQTTLIRNCESQSRCNRWAAKWNATAITRRNQPGTRSGSRPVKCRFTLIELLVVIAIRGRSAESAPPATVSWWVMRGSW